MRNLSQFYRSFIFILILLFFAFLTCSFSRRQTLSQISTPVVPLQNSPSCPDTSNILLIIRTGITQIYRKLPVHFYFTFQCASHYLIFSDIAQNFGPGYEVLDALTHASPKVKAGDHLQSYRILQSFKDGNQDAAVLDREIGYKLDKFKFLPMTLQAYERSSEEIEWFIFVDDDSYVSWNNLVLFLKTLDPKEVLYIGSRIGEDPGFAHGGSGYAISRPAMQRVFEAEPEHRDKWADYEIRSNYGDSALSFVLQDVGVKASNARPHFQGQPYDNIVWDKAMWYRPAITWHHMSPQQIEAVWKFEAEFYTVHGPNSSILFSDFYEPFIKPHLASRRADWDNRNSEYRTHDSNFESEPPITEESCAIECVKAKSCLQWNFQRDSCQLFDVLRVGHQVGSDVGSVSGWMMPRIHNLVNELKGSQDTGWVMEKPQNPA